MAIYHFSGSVISRSQGRSAVACASYRSAEILHDERYEKTHDYTRKQDVIFSEILLPANAPVWMKEREKLWNAVEASEKRKDAQLARDFNFSLPRELSNEQNTLLAREFIQKNFVDKGMVADWAFHIDKTASGELQPHVHIMLTMREVDASGFGQKVREWNRKEELMLWREAWAENANRHLSLNGHDIHIDHRSNAEQGISLEAQYKIGTSVASRQMARMEDHQRIARENGEKIFENPQIALDAITKQQSTFTHQDLSRFINRQTEDAEQFQQVYEKVKSSPEIVLLGKDDRGRDRYTTQEMLSMEMGMMNNTDVLLERKGFAISDKSKSLALGSRNLSEQQKTAFEHLIERGDIKSVVGYAGSGKSYMLGAAWEAWEKEGYNVLGATLSGIAAENLEASSGIESRTLASRMYYWERGDQLLTSKDILVIDEAGMIGSRQMSKLIDEAQRHHAKVVLIGDPEQLQAIDAGASFRAITEKSGFVELTEIRRQKEEWQKEATIEFAKGQTQDALDRYQKKNHVHEFETQATAKKAVIEQWNDVRITNPEKTQIILTYTRKDVQDLNDMARDTRHALGELREDHALQTARGEKLFAEHDRVYFTQNDRDMGVKNGTLGTISKIEGNRLTVQIDKEEAKSLQPVTVSFDLEKYNHIDHGYAATIHKSQGVTVDRTHVLASRYMDRHAAYVAMSRHRDSADLFYSREEFKNERDLVQALGRDRAKDVSLDYSLSSPDSHFPQHSSDKINEIFAEHRGINVSEEMVREYFNEGIAFDDRQESMTQGEDRGNDIESDLMRAFNFSDEEIAKFSSDNLEAYLDLTERSDKMERDELMAFSEAFERENPDLAKMLSDEMEVTLDNNQAITVEREPEGLSDRMEKEKSSHAEIGRGETEMQQDNNTFNHAPEKETQKIKEIERDFEIDF